MTMRIQLLAILLGLSFMCLAQSDAYYRQLRYNHVSPRIEIAGVHPIDSAAASRTSHYIFRYDELNRLSEVVNNHYYTEKVHPLASLGAYKTLFSYEDGKETRTFYDPNNKRVANDRGVYKEVYLLGEDFEKKQVNFFDVEDNPTESNWNIAEYRWRETDEFVVERRYNLKGELVPLSPYFDFGITGIAIDTEGAPKGHYNLNKQLEVVDNSVGLASYRDTYDSNGNHVKYTYHNSSGELVMNQWNYAVGEKLYDDQGNYTQLNLYDVDGQIIDTRSVYSNASVKLSPPASKEDSMEIRAMSLGYIEALQHLNPGLMDEVLNDDLNKITIGYDRGEMKQFGRSTTKAQMVEFAKSWNKTGARFPFNPNNQVEILDIYGKISTVKLISDNWVEYLQLIKLNGEWEIMNLLWQYKDVKMYKD